MTDALLRLENQRRLYTGLGLALAIAILISGYQTAESLNSGGFVQGLSKFFDYPSQIVREAIAKGPEFWPLFPRFFPALIETLNIALVATLIGGLLAMILSLAATRNLDVPERLIPVIRRIMDIMRAFPELIIALFLIFVLGASPVPAAIAVAFHTAGALGKLFSEINENIDVKQIEGLKATGASWIQRVRYGVIPQVLPNYTSYFLLRLEINVRASAILGFVGAGGIGSELARSIGWGDGAITSALFLMLFATIVVIDQLSSALRRRLTVATGGHSA
jgi:phosphonate transport system permease protein